MNFLKNLFGILGTIISIWGLFVILDSLGNRSEGAWVDPAGFGIAIGSILLVPGLIMLGLWWLIGKFVSKPSDNQSIKNEVFQSLNSSEKEQRRVESLGIEVATCPNCGTLNSLSLLICEKCKTNLEKVKPVRNPHI